MLFMLFLGIFFFFRLSVQGKKFSCKVHQPSRCLNPLRDGFVYLEDVHPEIVQEMRYFSYHNFIGNSIEGYYSGSCILTEKAAIALCETEEKLLSKGYTLKVYDCYRPQQSVDYFVEWAKNISDTRMKGEFYPDVEKENLFRDGYIASKSGHSRGSTMDLTIVPLPIPKEEKYHPGDTLRKCFAKDRFKDNMIDMGNGFDCFSPVSWLNATVPKQEFENRMLLKNIMVENHFVPYEFEWWHYTLANEPYPKTYFNFAVNCSSI